MISTIERIGELRETLQEARRAGARIALVPTMGALHDGHLALVDRAREIADVVVVSIFVNPLQFGPNEDLDRYPRDLAADVALLEERGVAHVFAPSVAEMYPDGPSSTRVVAGKVGSLYEGRSRPGHFDGMLTVVSKLLHIVQPDVAMFGQKDAQQLFLVRRMVRDLDLPVAIEGVDTVREEDGLALSSRNRYLDARERRAARTIPLLLEAAASAADRGIDAVIAAAQSASMGEPLVKLDYLVVANPATLLPVDDDHRGPALVLVAAVVGSTRLLDNGPILLA
ncbi:MULTISPECIES: pantoate--beta-alanine ligase [unclassified Rathayibacter]|uniref:pantoate--beta-alanine ligase n=1 Tax=unclassified Rathayibacter TaxID=2609250 RepID=UPI001FB1C916|nr:MULTISPECIES: pantoate--beta-alanine ligase [unclassified Rathayibacter]MCJ1671757.1 pantoate--beta-alanine ligase [Rathayibacter sp. VKM Ac-2929]MCJ1684071.1 pantoate--beta-alanine ligase [Rathayibacter sp. VKM Ac-2928]MCJ1702678.1 pantoate--beta-alanine ligase [Rathayibacter sp. VKM Ac-2926]